MRLALSIAIVCLPLWNCGPKTPQAIEVSAYEAEQLLCVDKAATRAAADVCKAAVRAKYAPFWADAGPDANVASPFDAKLEAMRDAGKDGSK